jgi:hypothetical protein
LTTQHEHSTPPRPARPAHARTHAHAGTSRTRPATTAHTSAHGLAHHASHQHSNQPSGRSHGSSPGTPRQHASTPRPLLQRPQQDARLRKDARTHSQPVKHHTPPTPASHPNRPQGGRVAAGRSRPGVLSEPNSMRNQPRPARGTLPALPAPLSRAGSRPLVEGRLPAPLCQAGRARAVRAPRAAVRWLNSQ